MNKKEKARDGIPAFPSLAFQLISRRVNTHDADDVVQVGIAVATATDVAKSAAGIVLTESGLAGIVTVVREGRIVFQRMAPEESTLVSRRLLRALAARYQDCFVCVIPAGWRIEVAGEPQPEEYKEGVCVPATISG